MTAPLIPRVRKSLCESTSPSVSAGLSLVPWVPSGRPLPENPRPAPHSSYSVANPLSWGPGTQTFRDSQVSAACAPGFLHPPPGRLGSGWPLCGSGHLLRHFLLLPGWDLLAADSSCSDHLGAGAGVLSPQLFKLPSLETPPSLLHSVLGDPATNGGVQLLP